MGNKGRRGGAQPGAGRKRKVDEEWSRKICIEAIEKAFGTIEAGIEIILKGKDERLKQFIWTHVLGNPETTSKIKLSDSEGGKLKDGLGSGKIIVEVVRTVHNKDVPADGGLQNENDDSTRLPNVQ